MFEWELISLRLAGMGIKGFVYNLNVLAVYGPTFGAADTTKDAFSMNVQRAIGQNFKSDLLTIFPLATLTHYGRFLVGNKCANSD